MIKLTLLELKQASEWAESHSTSAHDGKLPYAAISIRHFGNSGIGDRVLVMCEECDGKPGNAGNRKNYEDVTDYECW